MLMAVSRGKGFNCQIVIGGAQQCNWSSFFMTQIIVLPYLMYYFCNETYYQEKKFVSTRALMLILPQKNLIYEI